MDVQSRRDRCGLYEFAQFMLDVPEGELTCGAERIHRSEDLRGVGRWSRALTASGDTRRSPAYLETVSRAGYRFIAEVRDLTAAEATGGKHDMRADA